ncbi:ABC transporter permease [uncultured Mesonia sp.]|uniref:ABC transporter permease n=1 Tax=uncultured Mesonia sp. TaxID=399731 RepID=UPI00374E85B2
MGNLSLIIKREYLARIKNKAFVIMTFLSPLLVVGMIFLVAYLSSLNNDEKKIIALHDVQELINKELPNTNQLGFVDFSNLPIDQAIMRADKEKLYGLLYVPAVEDAAISNPNIEFFAKEAPSSFLVSDLEQKISRIITDTNLANAGIDKTQLQQAQTKVNLQIEDFDGQSTSKLAGYVKMIFGGAAGYLLMMFIIIYGNMVMRSVIEEKTNRIVEIIISSVKPFQLMLGKITGTSLAGLTQFLIWLIFGGVILLISSSLIAPNEPGIVSAATPVDSDEIALLFQNIMALPLFKISLSFFIYFIGGYFLYSAIYAAIGAAVDSETDTQQFMFPIIVPLMLGIYVGFFTVIENPHGTVATLFSHIPLTSPIVMLMRIPFGVAWWEVLISLSILFASVFLVIIMAAKIYRIGILMYGKKPTYKELFKWLKN